jgi:hypothetical protein
MGTPGQRTPTAWTLRKRNGDLYPCPDLGTLKRWAAERKALRDEEVSHQGGPWRRVGDLPELAESLAAADRAREAAVARQAEPGLPAALPGIAEEKWEKPAAPSEGAEPAWTTGKTPTVPVPLSGAPARQAAPARDAAGPHGHGPGHGRKPLWALAGLAAAVAMVVWIARPGWRGGEAAAPAAAPTASKSATPSPTPTPTPTPSATPTPSTRPTASPTQSPTPEDRPPSAPSSGRDERPRVEAHPADAPPPPPSPVQARPAPPAEPPGPAAEPPPRATPAAKPKTPKALLADARRLRQRGQATAALDVYGRVLDAEPENADALAGRGWSYLDLSQIAPARSSFEAALQAEPKHAGALMGLAETFRYEGRRAQAVSYYNQYLEAHPEGEDASAARSALEALKE